MYKYPVSNYCPNYFSEIIFLRREPEIGAEGVKLLGKEE
jgi:hypothetical protein